MLSKYIFLDVDGVLNSEEYFIKRDKRDCKNDSQKFLAYDLDEIKIHMLNEIIEKTNATIVLSSSWRIFGLERVTEALKSKDFKYEIPFSTTLKHMDRGEQIRLFIVEYNIEEYIILDDETCDIKGYLPMDRIFETSWESGLQQNHVENIVKYFNKVE